MREEEKQEPEYSFDELIELTEEIKKNGYGDFSPVKATLCLAKEIKKIQHYLDEYCKAKQKRKKTKPESSEES